MIGKVDISSVVACSVFVLAAAGIVLAGQAGDIPAAPTAKGASVQFDTIGGNLPLLVKARGRSYYVVSDIEVPAGKTVRIEPGAVFCFKNFAGLHVQGVLIAEGTKDKPIMFTSALDHAYNPSSAFDPNPFDWNGVSIHADGFGSHLSNCTIRYSVYGLVSETKFIRLDPVSFAENGKSDLVIEGVRQTVGTGPYSYVLSVKDAVKNGVPVTLLKDPNARRRNVYRLGGMALFGAGCALGIYEAIQYANAESNLSQLSGTGFDNLRYGQSAQWTSERNRRDLALVLTGGGILLGAVGAVGFCWSFTF